jgi:hypothetical protein
MADYEVKKVVDETTQTVEKPIGIFGAIALILKAMATNITSAGPVEMTNIIRTIFRSFIATVLIAGGGSFLWKAAFVAKASTNEHTGIIVGFITGSVIATAVNFYFGGQDRSKEIKKPITGEEVGEPPK